MGLSTPCKELKNNNTGIFELGPLRTRKTKKGKRKRDGDNGRPPENEDNDDDNDNDNDDDDDDELEIGNGKEIGKQLLRSMKMRKRTTSKIGKTHLIQGQVIGKMTVKMKEN